ncbi:MAG: hypothetical protein Q8P48_03915, partial [Deltaproteobacteria bacterium]|nr:hypothetical protein [Deltaproteobacteria bacterium]
YLATGLLETALTLAALAIAASTGLAGHLGAAFVIFILYDERFRRRSLPGASGMPALAPSGRRSRAAAGVLALLAFQGSFVASFLPFAPLEAALLLTLLIVLVREAISLAFLGELTKVRVIQGVLAGLAGSLLLFSAVPWSV